MSNQPLEILHLNKVPVGFIILGDHVEPETMVAAIAGADQTPNIQAHTVKHLVGVRSYQNQPILGEETPEKLAHFEEEKKGTKATVVYLRDQSFMPDSAIRTHPGALSAFREIEQNLTLAQDATKRLTGSEMPTLHSHLQYALAANPFVLLAVKTMVRVAENHWDRQNAAGKTCSLW